MSIARSLLRLVVLTAAAFAVVPSAAQNEDPPECQCQEGDIKRLGLAEAIAEGKGWRFENARKVLGISRSGKPYVICNQTPCPVIDVRVIENPETRRCEAWLDYCRLCVLKKNAFVRFRLVDSAGRPIRPDGNYEFSSTAVGIEIDDAMAGGKRHFEQPGFDPAVPGKVRFRWFTGPDKTVTLPAQGLPHRARVVRKNPAEPCDPKDPIIVNNAN